MGWFSRSHTPALSEHSSDTLADLIASDLLQNLSSQRDAALGVSSILRARQINADTLSSLPLKAGGSLVPAPNASQDVRSLVAETVLSLQDHGDAYWRVTANGFSVLPFERMTVTWSDSGSIARRRIYKFGHQVMRTTGLTRNLLVLSMNRGVNDLRGFGWLMSGRVAGVIAIDKYNQEYFQNNAMPAGIMSVPSEPTEDEAKLLKAQIRASQEARSLMIKPKTWDYEMLSFTPNDSEWVESHIVSIGDIATLSGVPSFLLNHVPKGSSTTYDNVEQILVRLWRETLAPTYARRIEAAWTDVTGIGVRFDPEELFLASVLNRANAAAALAGAGYDGAGVADAVGLPSIPFERVSVPNVLPPS